MNRREAFRAAVQHKNPDRVILDLGGCPLSGLSPEAAQSLADLLGYSGTPGEVTERVLRYLDIDTRGVGWILRPQKSPYRKLSETAYIDEWGIERRFTGLYWDIVTPPLRGASIEDLDDYPWPDPSTIDDRDIEAIADQARAWHQTTDYAVCASHPVYGVFELGLWMCGFDDFMMKMALEPDFVRRFFDIALDYQLKVIERYYPPLAPYIDYTSSGDDFATQASLFVSPAMFGEFIAPAFAERIRRTRELSGTYYLHHSCGNVSRLIPQLIDCGVQILNPIQPTGDDMRPDALKRAFGDRIVFHGGLDTQQALPGGTRDSVARAVYDLLNVMQPGGGYIFAAAHNLQADVPPENIVAMFRAARNWRRGM
ncbi:MAG: methyltransferase [Clostridiales bacterium]|nr:methyltransferase [Clostridiales bacterium]